MFCLAVKRSLIKWSFYLIPFSIYTILTMKWFCRCVLYPFFLHVQKHAINSTPFEILYIMLASFQLCPVHHGPRKILFMEECSLTLSFPRGICTNGIWSNTKLCFICTFARFLHFVLRSLWPVTEVNISNVQPKFNIGVLLAAVLRPWLYLVRSLADLLNTHLFGNMIMLCCGYLVLSIEIK